jgi:carbon-monoxide dehydrogenase medium subunit
MIPAAFEYRSPETLEEALAILDQAGEEAKVLTGGHSLIPAMKLRLATPAIVIDLRRITALRGIAADGGGVRIGALATHAEVERSELVRERCPILAEAAGRIGDVQVRNRGTLCGSICHADPAADYPAALLALDAEVLIASRRGDRVEPLDGFLRGLLSTSLEVDELVRAVRVPRAAPASAAYVKMSQSASGFAIAGVAAQLWMKRGVIERAAIGVTGIADRAFRAADAELAISGKAIGAAMLETAVRNLAGARELLSDIHASADYRRHLADVLGRRAVAAAAARASY